MLQRLHRVKNPIYSQMLLEKATTVGDSPVGEINQALAGVSK